MELEGLFVTAAGWTVQQLDDTPWPRVMSIRDYWGENPPLHLLVKAYMGIKSKKETPAMTASEFMQGLKGTGL